MREKCRQFNFWLLAVLIFGGFSSAQAVTIYEPAAAGGAVGANVLDYDGDRRTDFAVYRNGAFIVNPSGAGNAFFNVPFGVTTDLQAPGDYDGDGKTDIAVWRPANGTFYVIRSLNNTFQAFQFGQLGDEPAPRDFDGDRRTDFAVVRRVGGATVWFFVNSSNNAFNGIPFGAATDFIAPGDYDGDGRFDLAVFRAAPPVIGQTDGQGTFFVQQSTAGFRAQQFGLGTDLVVPGDYDGDKRYDFALLRTASTAGAPFTWLILQSGGNIVRSVQFGGNPQLSVQGDYDGDGRTDIAVWDPRNGTFFILRSSAANNAGGGFAAIPFGQNGDYPIANFDTY